MKMKKPLNAAFLFLKDCGEEMAKKFSTLR
jgi:hypothetical protein